jgi:hypothetical protein
MSINPTPYNTQTCINSKTIRFFWTRSGTDIWVAYDDVIAALGAQDWSTRLPNNTGQIYPGVPEDNVTRFVATGGMVQAVPILQMTVIADGAPMIGPAAQAIRNSVLAALIAGAAAKPP